MFRSDQIKFKSNLLAPAATVAVHCTFIKRRENLICS